MKFKCKNCSNGYCIIPEKYKNGKNLKIKESIEIKISCNNCESTHTIHMKFKQRNKHNIFGILVDFQYTKELKISSVFCFKETKDDLVLDGYINHCYLLLGFDSKEKEIKEKIKSIKNEADKTILDSCFKIIKITRNKIAQHNKYKKSLSSLITKEIFQLFISSADIMVNLFNKNGYLLFDTNDRRIEEREIIFE